MSSLSRARASRLPALRQCCYYSFNALLNLNYLSTTTTTNSTTATTRISTSTSTSAAPSRPLLSSVVTGRRRRESGESSIKSSSEIVFRTFASSAATSSSTPRSDVLLRNQKLPSSSLLGQVRSHQHHDDDPDAEKILVVFVDKDGDEYEIQAPVGKNLLEIAHMNDIELEGACEGSLACSTCHVIIEDEDQYDMLDEPDEDEEDMLDLAFGLTETSRLGCQVICKPELDGLRVKIPNATRNMAVDGFVPKPH